MLKRKLTEFLVCSLVFSCTTGCSRQPLVSESYSDGRFHGGKRFAPAAPAPVLPSIIDALRKEGFALSITNIPSESMYTNPGFESDHIVIHFTKSTLTGSLNHYRDLNMDHFDMEVSATDEMDKERCSYYRFRDKLTSLLDGAYR